MKYKELTIDEVMSMIVEKIKDINEFVEKVVTDARLEQGLSYLRENNLPTNDIVSIGVFFNLDD